MYLYADDTKADKAIHIQSELWRWHLNFVTYYQQNKRIECHVVIAVNCGKFRIVYYYFWGRKLTQIIIFKKVTIHITLGIQCTCKKFNLSTTLEYFFIQLCHSVSTYHKKIIKLIAWLVLSNVISSIFGQKIILLYKTLVRPHIEYANSVWWHPYENKDFENIEKVQRRATKLVKGLKKDKNVWKKICIFLLYTTEESEVIWYRRLK